MILSPLGQQEQAQLGENTYMEVRYEDFVEAPHRIMEQILDFCGLDWDDRCLNFHQTKRSVSTLSVSQVRKPIYRDSVKLWEKYGDKLNDLKDALGALV